MEAHLALGPLLRAKEQPVSYLACPLRDLKWNWIPNARKAQTKVMTV